MRTVVPQAMSMPDRLASILRQKIETGEWPPGHKLPIESQLTETLSVSRTVLREAIARLKNDGMLIGRRGSGVYVTDGAGMSSLRIEVEEGQSLEAILDILVLRRALESECASLAAIHRSDADIAEIDLALTQIADDIEAGRIGVQADVAFHKAVARAAGNPYILKTLGFFSRYLAASIHTTRSNESRSAQYLSQVLSEHRSIAEAIRDRDPAAAFAAAQTHMFNAARRLRKEMEASPTPGAAPG